MGSHAMYNFLTFGTRFSNVEQLREAYEKNKAHKRVLWTTALGERIPVGKMTDNHLFHTARFLIRKAIEFQHSIPFPCFQGEMAQYEAENQYECWTEADSEEVATWLFGNKAVAIFQECADRTIDYEKEG